MKLILLLLFCLPISALAQKPSQPRWESQSTFHATQIRVLNQATNKLRYPIAEFTDLKMGDYSIDLKVGSILAFKSTTLTKKTYTLYNSIENYTYEFSSGGALIKVNFFYNDTDSDPFKIMISGYRDSKNTATRYLYELTQLKKS